MRAFGILTISSALLLSGCIGEKIARRAVNDQALVATAASRVANGQICCDSYRQMQFKQLGHGIRQEIALDASSQIYNFSFGKSRFSAYSIPPVNTGDELVVGALELYSGSSARPIFRPAIIFLSETYELLLEQPTVVLNDHFIGWSTEGHAAHIPLTPTYSNARYVIVVADPSFVGSSYSLRKHSNLMPAGGALVSMPIPEQKFPYGYEGKGFLEIKRQASR